MPPAKGESRSSPFSPITIFVRSKAIAVRLTAALTALRPPDPPPRQFSANRRRPRSAHGRDPARGRRRAGDGADEPGRGGGLGRRLDESAGLGRVAAAGGRRERRRGRAPRHGAARRPPRRPRRARAVVLLGSARRATEGSGRPLAEDADVSAEVAAGLRAAAVRGGGRRGDPSGSVLWPARAPRPRRSRGARARALRGGRPLSSSARAPASRRFVAARLGAESVATDGAARPLRSLFDAARRPLQSFAPRKARRRRRGAVGPSAGARTPPAEARRRSSSRPDCSTSGARDPRAVLQRAAGPPARACS